MVAIGAVAAKAAEVAEAAATEEAVATEVAEAEVTAEVVQEMAKEIGSEAIEEMPSEIMCNNAVESMPQEITKSELGNEVESTLDNTAEAETENADVSKETTSEANSEETSHENLSVDEVKEPIKNKQDGLAREAEVNSDLLKEYPKAEGYEVCSEAYLRDETGKIVKDTVTGEARRIDFVVIKEGKVVDSIEVTSKTAPKELQMAKEARIRADGGNFIKDEAGNLARIPDELITRIERRD